MKKSLVVLLITLVALTLVVGCKKEPEAKKQFTVTFDYAGGVYNSQSSDTDTVESGKTVSEPVFNPVKNKYTKFDCWTKKDGTKFDFENEKITSDITLYAKYKELYSVGGRGEKGGWIIYDVDADNTADGGAGNDGLKSSVCGYRFLEASPSDFSTVVNGTNTYDLHIGTTTNELSTQESLGSGANNTKVLAESTTLNSFAKDIYGHAGAGGATDWFIPSKDELYLVYRVIGKNATANFTKGDYWSSSLRGASSAYCLYFGGDSEPNKNKTSSYTSSTARVRLVRVF